MLAHRDASHVFVIMLAGCRWWRARRVYLRQSPSRPQPALTLRPGFALAASHGRPNYTRRRRLKSRKHRWEGCGIATVRENQMSQVLECRERLENAHKQIHEVMTELITNKDYSEAERRLYAVDELMLDLIEEMGGTVVRSNLWT
jgi:hypothetical protein